MDDEYYNFVIDLKDVKMGKIRTLERFLDDNQYEYHAEHD